MAHVEGNTLIVKDRRHGERHVLVVALDSVRDDSVVIDRPEN